MQFVQLKRRVHRKVLAVAVMVLLLGTHFGGLQPAMAANSMVEISTPAELQAIKDDMNGHYVLVNDLDMTGFTWEPLWAVFNGTFDGNGNTISGLDLSRTAMESIGLFWVLGATAHVHNVTITDSTIHAYNSGGLLAGTIRAGAVVENCSISGTATSTWRYSGGLAAENAGTIRNCHVNVDVTADGGGGLVGSNSGTIENSSAAGTVTRTGLLKGAGGLVGNNSGTVIESYATGNVSGGEMVGGLVGWDDGGTIRDASAAGNVTGFSSVGGLVGKTTGTTIVSSTASGDVTGVDHVGGLVGEAGDTASGERTVITSSHYRSGSIQGHTNVGGLVGYNGSGSDIVASTAAGGLAFTIQAGGGLVGRNDGTVRLSSASTTVDATDAADAGGLVGWNKAVIDASNASGTVSGATEAAGGLVGYHEGRITNSYASGSVAGGKQVGGLVGAAFGGAISVSHATGAVAGNREVGGLVGELRGGAPLPELIRVWATGSVTGTQAVGGLIGRTGAAAGGGAPRIADTYATGQVSGMIEVGGLIGVSEQVELRRSYYSGNVSATAGAGAVIGDNASDPIVEAVRWNADKAGLVPAASGWPLNPPEVQGLTDAQMKDPANFTGWDFIHIWGIDKNQGYPHLDKPGVRGSSSGSGGGGAGGGSGDSGSGSGASHARSGVTPVFSDIKGHWAEAAIVKLAASGVVHGVGDNRFEPEGDVTRAQFAKMIILGLGLKVQPNPRLTFADADQIPDWARGFVATAVAEGIIKGLDGNRFGPDELITREQIATMVARALGLKATGDLVLPDGSTVSDWAKDAVQVSLQHGIMLRRANGNFAPQAHGTRADAAYAIARMQILQD